MCHSQASRHERLSRQGWSTGGVISVTCHVHGHTLRLGGQKLTWSRAVLGALAIRAEREICLFYHRFRVGGL